jgi:CRP-like cAMP-binding protein
VEGSTTDGLFLLRDGTLRFTRQDDSSHDTVLGEETGPAAILTPGLFDGGLNCTTATAVTDCTVHLVRRTALLDLCHETPDLLLTLTAALSRRDRRTADFIDLVTVADVRQRVARLLLDLCHQCGATRLVLPHSHSTLAQSLGTVREVLFRSLKHLQAAGVLRFRGGDIVIEDECGLRDAAGVRGDVDPVFDRDAAPPTPCYLALLLRRPE